MMSWKDEHLAWRLYRNTRLDYMKSKVTKRELCIASEYLMWVLRCRSGVLIINKDPLLQE